jgi:hypothetical protein
MSLVLLTNAGLLVRSLQEIGAVDCGIRTDDYAPNSVFR